jgi:hypothetical protein
VPAGVLAGGCSRFLLGLASGAALICCGILVFEAAAMQALTERGHTAVCVIEQAKKQTVTTGSGSDTHTSTQYAYRLRCADDGPASMVTYWPAGDQGTRIQVAWDPSGRLEPRPVDQLTGDEFFRIALTLAGTALVLSLLDAVIDVLRYPHLTTWGSMNYFNQLAKRWS